MSIEGVLSAARAGGRVADPTLARATQRVEGVVNLEGRLTKTLARRKLDELDDAIAGLCLDLAKLIADKNAGEQPLAAVDTMAEFMKAQLRQRDVLRQEVYRRR